MTDKFAEVKQKHAEQVASILAETHPTLTPGQVKRIQKECAEVISDWTLAPLVKVLNAATVQGLLWKHPELSRTVPARSDAQTWLEQKWLADFEASVIPASEQISIKRRIDKMSDDELLALVPANFSAAESALSEADLLEARTAQPNKLSPAEQHKADSEWLEYTFGPDYANHKLDPVKRRELLAARDANENRSLRADAQRLDGYAARFGADAPAENLSGTDMVARERAKRALARAK